MNLAQRARKAAGLTQVELAKLLGVKQQLLSRWEKGAKMSAPAVALMRLLERDAEVVVGLLRNADEPGFAGDGGPPPRRDGGFRPMVDEFGNPLAEGSGDEPDLGWAPDEAIGIEDDGDFYAPDFTSAEGQT